MKFGPVSAAQAEGCIAAHSIHLGADTIRKGAVITAADVARIVSAGVSEVTVARLEDADMHEDAAATRLAAALVPDPESVGLRVTRAATGRVNFYAEVAGVVRINIDAVHAFNAVHPMVTLATLSPFQRVEAGAMIATVKIIAYSAPEDAVAKAANAAQAALSMLPPIYKTATLIETTTTGDDPTPKGRRVLAGRLDRLGVGLSDRVIVRHEESGLATAITDAPGEVIFILTGSATSDGDDTAPQALRRAGGTVIHFGMPVDPGNLLFLGTTGGKPVIGLPGCARSPALNGADWVLERVLCGVQLTPADFAAMGVGGLLKEIPTRPKPRGDIGG